MKLTFRRPARRQEPAGPRLSGLPFGWIMRSAAATIIAGLAVLSAVAALIGWGIASAGNDDLTGRSISDKQLTAIVSAARSCPILTPARIAGQLMAESGLDDQAPNTASGGRGIAGIDDADWKRWAPWPKAVRQDSTANILALAHQMCDLSGQLRVAKTAGDPWRLSLAAYRSGLRAVTQAGAEPDSARDYVDAASGYAAWYAKLPQFGGQDSGQPAPTGSGPATGPGTLPDEYVEPVLMAGAVCEQVSAPAVAAQLMAASRFDPNLLGDNGEQGIAQFRPDVWQSYAPAEASAWDPTTAIKIVGTAMCGLVTELSGLEGDTYPLALAAFRAGPTAVRQAGGMPDAATETFVSQVTSYTGFYAGDPRLSGGKQSSPSASAPASPPASPTATTRRPATSSPKPQPTYPNALVGKASGKCMSAGAGGDGTRLTMRPCDGSKAQSWDIRNDGTIRTALNPEMCMDVAWAKTEDGTPVQIAHCSGNPAQQFVFTDGGSIRSILADKCLDVEGGNDSHANDDGAKINIWSCVSYEKQTWTLKK